MNSEKVLGREGVLVAAHVFGSSALSRQSRVQEVSVPMTTLYNSDQELHRCLLLYSSLALKPGGEVNAELFLSYTLFPAV